VVRFLGYIDKWEPTFPDGGSNRVVVHVTATDQMRLLARHKLNPTFTEWVDVIAPTASVWQCDETAGTSFGDKLGNRDPVTIRVPRAGTGGVSYTQDTSATYVSKGVQLTPSQWGATGRYTSRLLRLPITLPASGYTIGWWQKPAVVDGSGQDWSGNDYSDGTNKADLSIAWSGVWSLTHTAAGIPYTALAATPAPSTSGYSFIVLTMSATTATVYVNGVSVGSVSTVSPIASAYKPIIGGRWNEKDQSGGLGYVAGLMVDQVFSSASGTIASIFYSATVLTGTDITNLYTAGVVGFNGDTTSTRAQRLMQIPNITSYTLDPADGLQVGPLDTDGKDIVALWQDLAISGYGIMYIDGTGQPQWHDSKKRRATLTAAATFANEADTTGTDFALPIQESQFYNSVTISATGGGSYTSVNQTSIDAIGVVSLSQDLNLYSSAEARDRAGFWISMWGTPTPRISKVQVDMFTSGTAGIYSTVFALDLDSRIRITGLPTTGPASQVDAFIEGWTETYSIDSANIVFDCSPAEAPGYTMINDNTAPYSADYDLTARLDCDGSQTVNTTINATATSLTAAVPAVTFTTTDVPFDITLDGEILSVTAAAAASAGTQVLTVVRGQYGTNAVAHSTGTAIYLAHQPILSF
jgi:hypothetical protein